MKSQDSLSDFSINWSTSVREIPFLEWNNVFGGDIIKNQDFFLAMEKASFLGVSFHYLQISQNGVIISIVPCFCYEMDLLNLITSLTAKYVIQGIRKICPTFFKIRALVTGTYAASCEHCIEYKSNLSAREKEIVSELINKQLRSKCKETKSKFIFIKDVRGRNIVDVQTLLGNDFYFYSSFPTTVIPILTQKKYPEALKSKYRKRFQDYKKTFEEIYTWEISVNFAAYINQFTDLYKNVLNKAKNKFEFLNADFFDNINTLFPDKSFLLMAKDKEGEVRLMVLILEDIDCLIPLYMGIKYKTDDTRVLYISALGRMVKEAECRRKSYVDLGQTSYYPKVMSGAFVEDVYYGFWSNHFLLKYLIKNIFPKFFIPQEVPENIYLEACKAEACKVLENKGFSLLNK